MRGAVALILAIVNCVGLSLCNEEGDHVKYTNSWAVHVGDLDQDAVTGIATKYGFTNRGQIGKLHGYYLFERKNERGEGRRKRSIEDHTELLMSEPMIGWVKQQRILDRSKRNVISDDGHASRDRRDMAVSVQDPYFKDQWYLQNIGQSSGPAGLDINVLPVWGRGFTGQGVVVSILDDGVDHTHPDLKKNYDSSASFDFNDFDADPRPRSTDPLNCHGTRCAGEVAAEADNGICGVGVSFNASIGGIRMLDGLATDVIESLSLGYRSDYIDIYTCCWGPKDDGKRFGKPGFLASKSLKIGARKGRGGKGNIFVWATGNGGLTDDDCNCDGYTTSIYTISIGAISDHGLSTYYTETCASTIAVTFSGASHREADENKIVTTDLNHQCTRTFKGTSSAAPLASGMLALVLEANPNLTWRDVQHIIVETSQKTSPFDEGWTLNGAGKQFNHKFGFGKLDTMRMVDAALNWKLVAKQRVCHDTRYNTSRNIPSSGSLIISANTSSCDGTTSEVRKLEHVQVVITLKHRRRGDLSIFLISPSGTRSQLLKTRRNDKSTEGLTDWVFMTVHFWGEDPKGSWSLIITDNDRNTREHHLIKAKQGDMEDVQRVVIDDSEKRGNWDSRVVNEYERHKQATPGNATLHDHILKNVEDTTGELVKGNKFVELAKRLKNRKKNTNVFKAENTHTEHARNASKIPKTPHAVKNAKKNNYQKNSKHWHKIGKHKKMFRKHHKVSHRKHLKHPFKRHKKIAYRVVKHKAKLRSKNISSKHKSRNNVANKTFKSKNLMDRNSKYSNSIGKTEQTEKTSKTEKSDTEPLLADGSLEIPPGSSSKAKLALQALATPLIQKIMGISKTASFLPLKPRQSLVGEVDIKMKLYGSGANKPKRKRRKIGKLDFARSKVQNEHYNRLNKVKSPNLYVKLLRSMNGINENSQELKERKEKHINQVTHIHDNITDSEQSLTGSHLNGSEYTGMVSNGSVSSGKLDNEGVSPGSHLNGSEHTGMISNEKLGKESVQVGRHINGSKHTGSLLNGSGSTYGKGIVGSPKHSSGVQSIKDSDESPLIFYDADSKKYVALTKVGTTENASPFVIASEGSGNGNQHQHKPEVKSEDMESSGELMNDSNNCGGTGDEDNCINNNNSDEYLNTNWEDEDEDQNNRNLDQQNNKTKEPADDFGEVGLTDNPESIEQATGSKLNGNGNIGRNDSIPSGSRPTVVDDFPGRKEGSEMVTNGPLNITDYSNIGNQPGSKSPGSETINKNDFPGSEERPKTGSITATNGLLNTKDYSNIENQPGIKSPGSESISKSGFTGSKMYKPETKITENLHSNMNDKSKENKKFNEHHEIIDTHNNERHFNPLPINTKESHSTNATHKIDENEKIKNGNDNEDGRIEDKNNEILSKMTNYDDENGSETMGNKLDSKSEEKYLETNFEDDHPIFRNSTEGVSGEKKIKKKVPKDDFGSVDKNEIDSNHQSSFSKNRYAAKKPEHAYDIPEPLDEKVMKMRFETEYGKLNKTVRDEDYLGNDVPRYESDSELKGSGSKHVQDEELVNDRAFEETGNENSGSGSDFGVSGSGQPERFYDFGDHYQGGAMMAVNDDVVGSDDITNDVIQNGKQHHKSRFDNNNVVASSGDEPVHSGNGMAGDELDQQKTESIAKPSSARKQQKLNQKPLKLGYRNATNENYVNESKESNVKSPKSTNKAPLQNMVPVNVSHGNTHNNGPISDVVPPQQVVGGILQNTVPVNVSLGNTHNNGSISDVVPPQHVAEGSLQNTVPVNVSRGNIHNNGSISDVVPPQQVAEGPIPNMVYADDATINEPDPISKGNNEIGEKKLSDHENKENVPSQEMAQYVPNSYVPETQAEDKVPVEFEEYKVPDHVSMHADPQASNFEEMENALHDNSNLRGFSTEKPADNIFLRRVKQDIKHRNIDDLEQLESEVKNEMKRTMKEFNDDSSKEFFRNILGPELQDDDDSDGTRLFRRDLVKSDSKDYVPTHERLKRIVRKNEQEHSGILESWNLIFYGT